MSGHSKWSTIKRQKGVADQKRGQLFTKFSFAITMAVKQGGGVADPNSNFKLRLAVDKAKASNMPKDSIDRAIQKAAGSKDGDMVELVYEGFAPGGVAVIVETVTDNKQRTISEVKNIFDKNGGSLGNPGSVAYMFVKTGEITAKKDGRSSDDLLSFGLEAGADDMEEADDVVFYYIDQANLMNLRKFLTEKGIVLEDAQLVYRPKNLVPCDEETAEKVMNFVEKLEDLDDVQKVYTNIE